MRIVEEIPHPSCKITLFQWNEKYLIKIEQGLLEQTFKINEMDLTGPGDIHRILNEDFIKSALGRFRDMHADLVRAMENI